MEKSDVKTQYDKQYEALSKRIIFNEEIHGTQDIYKAILDALLEDSKYIALSTIYPFEDYYEMELPNKLLNWQIRACIELYNMADKAMFINYSENGLSFTKLTDGLSKTLQNELISKVGTPKRKDSN